MYRAIIEKLKEWKESSIRKPLILRGARQVGKTWLLKHFGRDYVITSYSIHYTKLYDGSKDNHGKNLPPRMGRHPQTRNNFV